LPLLCQEKVTGRKSVTLSGAKGLRALEK
jgi:hypothetical protein